MKLRRRVKERMEKYRDRVNWAEEVRRFIESRLRELEAEENFEMILGELKKASWSVPKGFSDESVREDRDSDCPYPLLQLLRVLRALVHPTCSFPSTRLRLQRVSSSPGPSANRGHIASS